MDKQRVLIVNKFYYHRGGDCVCTLNVEKLLGEQGHETAVYAMSYPENVDSQWSGYFASEVKFGGSPASLLRAVKRTLGMGDVKKSFRNILAEFKPDVVHLNNIHSYLSPVLAELAKEAGATVVWTLHDYKLICPSYSCTYQGLPCEKCFSTKWDVVSRRCMKGSLAASVIAWLEALKWSRKRLERSVDRFICPSEFMYSKMAQAGFAESKMAVLCNFVDPVKLKVLSSSVAGKREENSYCYIGRLSHEKGISELLEVASQLPQYQLMVAGDGPLGEQLRAKYGACDNIRFLGRLGAEDVTALLGRCRASIIPSRWYENNPLGVIESLCAGTPVIGAEIGGIPELIDGSCGVTYAWDDADALRDAIVSAMSRDWNHGEISRKSITRFSPEVHYKQLIEIYSTSSSNR